MHHNTFQYDTIPIFGIPIQKIALRIEIQWNLDLRKILGVDKIFLKSRFFLISNTGKPLKVTNIA